MRLAIPLSILLLGTLAACSPAHVRYDYDVRADYSIYHSFDWAAGSEGTFTDRRIRTSVERELVAKGLRKAGNTPPDLLVNAYPVYRNDRTRTTGVGVGIGLRILPGVSVGLGTGSAKTQTQTLGRIVLEFRDTRNSQLVWKAEAQDVLEGDTTPEESETAIREAVAKMLERFPPKPSAKD